MTVIARCTSDVRNIAEDGPWTLEAQVRAYDLLDMLLGGGYMPKELLTAEDTEEFVRVYADVAQKVDESKAVTVRVSAKKSCPAFKGVKELLSKQADRFFLYATWGRKPGNEKLQELGLTALVRSNG